MQDKFSVSEGHFHPWLRYGVGVKSSGDVKSGDRLRHGRKAFRQY